MQDENRAAIAKAFEPLVSAAQGNARALALLSEQARKLGDIPRSVELAYEALTLAPGNREVAAIAARTIARTVPGYHAGMVRDQARNAAYEAALIRAITPESRILDIGSGSGLLAMMAARAGAREVFSCEMVRAVANAARANVEHNGYSDLITVIEKHSESIDPEQDLRGQVDIVVAEIFASDLVGEDGLPSLRDAAARLLKPGGRMIPQSGEIRCALAWFNGLDERRMGTECGFDLTAFNRILPRIIMLESDSDRLSLRSESATLFALDFASARRQPYKARASLRSTGGPANGVIQWIRLHMDEAGTYENRPGPDTKSHWACQFFPFEAPIDVPGGSLVRIAASRTNERLLLWAEDGD